MDERTLLGLGLDASEIRFYQAVLKGRAVTPAQIAKDIGIKRTTAYSMARTLADKGLIVEDATRRPKVFVPAGPEHIEGFLAQERRRFSEREQALTMIAEQVSQQQAEEHYPVPKITFVEEANIRSFLDKRGQVWSESMMHLEEKTFWGFQDPSFLEQFDAWIESYWKTAPKELDVKLLTNLTQTEREATKKYERRETKYWGEATNFKSTTWVLGEYVVILNTSRKPYYLIEMRSAPLAHDQREIFRNLWEMI